MSFKIYRASEKTAQNSFLVTQSNQNPMKFSSLFFTTVLLLAACTLPTNAQEPTCPKEQEFVTCTEAILLEAQTVCLEKPTQEEIESCACKVMTDIITECLPLCPVAALEGVTDLVAPYLDQCPEGANEVWQGLMETEAQQTSGAGTRVGGGSVMAAVAVSLVAMLLI
jgi:hypothetical protein